jgi:hypothetical protein
MMMGDPGFFGDLWGGIKGAATGLLTGGPLGAIGGALKGSGLIKPPTPTLTGFAPLGPPPVLISTPQTRVPGWTGIGQRAIPGGATGYQVPQNGGIPPKGYRLNKSDYFLRDGTFVPAGSKYVKIRRRNALNPKALDRAIGRVTSAKRASKKMGRITIRKTTHTH